MKNSKYSEEGATKMDIMEHCSKGERKSQGSETKNRKERQGTFFKRRLPAFVLTLALVFGVPMFPGIADTVSAEEPLVKIEQTGGYFMTQGDKNVPLKVKVTNNTKAKITFEAKTNLSATSGDLMEPSPSKGEISLNPGDSTELVFTINVSSSAKVTSQVVTVLLIDKVTNVGDILRSKKLSVSVSQKSATSGTGGTGDSLAAADLVHTLSNGDSIVAGQDNVLTLEFSNIGNTVMKDAKVSLTLPAGISINNGSNTASVGYVSIGDTKTVSFHLTADSTLESKNYPITVTISFKDKANAAQTIEQALYIPVEGSGTSSLSNVEITGVTIPKTAAIGDEFTMAFTVINHGKSATGKLKVYAEAPEGIINKTQSVFSTASIEAGGSESYTVTFFSRDSATEQNYAIKLAVESGSGDGAASTTQYAAIYLGNEGSGKVKTPQLMVSNYTYGGTFVQAGSEFCLSLDLRNTSGSQTLQNIKVTIDSADGTFVPVGSSNSFYIDTISKKDSANYRLFLATKPAAEQKTTPININMSYEDTSGNAFTATDVIAIPVMQDTRLVVDEIAPPYELYAGMETSASVQFYNMGKTPLSNLRVSVEGDFDTFSTTTEYVGNMAAGESETYDFALVPRAVGPMSGKVIFTYEDASGDEQTLEKEFVFEVMEMIPYEEEPLPEDMEGGKKIPWIPIAAVVAVLGGAGGVFFWKRHRKRKIHEEMEIDE
ncbi:MAG: CARDB domain-containing protein [Eubacteriales bacterium]|nr:CARDB domain-containing protein [Eubacteriales bacterium]MDD3349504.1 CARDB domain-containing protein [Eubacteriales bacterium]